MQKKWVKTIRGHKVSINVNQSNLKNKRFIMKHPQGIAAKLFNHWISLFVERA